MPLTHRSAPGISQLLAAANSAQAPNSKAEVAALFIVCVQHCSQADAPVRCDLCGGTLSPSPNCGKLRKLNSNSQDFSLLFR